ncbi:MAG: outer membrane protein assembly factor BamA [Lentisphaerae bacterium]|nr:outer membrane protein assembly factor BamA [Lentisphaerota bacterium]
MFSRKFFKAALSLAGCWALMLTAAEVGAVKFVQEGKNPVPQELLQVALRLRPGMEFKAEHMDEDLKNLYKTGKISNAVSEYRTLPDGKIEITYKITPSPLISVFRIEGNKKFSTKDLQGELTIADGERLSSRALSQSVENLRKFYHGKGYTDVRIPPPEVKPDGKGGVTVTLKIEENLRLKVNNVTFEGNTAYSARELRQVLFNRYSLWNIVPFVNDHLNQGMLDRKELDADRARVRELYYNKGFLDFKVKDVKITQTSDDPEFVDLHFILEEGKPYTVDKITISGNNVIKNEIIEGQIMLKSGEIYSLEKENATIKAIGALYDTDGYADLSVKPVKSTDFPNSKVSIEFKINEGRKYHIRNIDIIGNTGTKEKVIRRELAIHPGDPAASRRIEVSRKRLMNMGYFNKVEAETVNADSLDEKDLRITVEEKPERFNFRIGAGVSDVTSFFGMAEISSNNFDITDPGSWFYGGGQRLRIQALYGIDDAGFNVDFVEPWLFDLPLRFELSAYMNTSEYDEWDESRIGARTSLQRKIFDDFTTVNLGYKFEVVRVHRVSSSLKYYFKEKDYNGSSLVSQVSLHLARDTRDSLVDPTEGYYVSLYGAISPRIFGSSSDFYRLEAKGSYHTSFFDKAIVLSLSGKIGVVSGFNTHDDVPVYERYFLGGSGSVRGFEHRSIGRIVNGKNIGGQTMLVLSAEVSHPIWGPLRGAAFIDAGDAWSNAYSMDFSSINIGAGYGLRLKLPMFPAPLKLDIAYPVLRGQRNLKSKFRIHFNVGFSF